MIAAGLAVDRHEVTDLLQHTQAHYQPQYKSAPEALSRNSKNEDFALCRVSGPVGPCSHAAGKLLPAPWPHQSRKLDATGRCASIPAAAPPPSDVGRRPRRPARSTSSGSDSRLRPDRVPVPAFSSTMAPLPGLVHGFCCDSVVARYRPRGASFSENGANSTKKRALDGSDYADGSKFFFQLRIFPCAYTIRLATSALLHGRVMAVKVGAERNGSTAGLRTARRDPFTGAQAV